MADLKQGDTGFWFNTISCQNRPVTIVKVLKAHYVVKTEDGHRYSPPKMMVSAKRAMS